MSDLTQTQKAPATVKPVGPDFCLVQLTAAGVTLAGGHPLRYSNGRQQFVFPADNTPQKVARYEWQLALEPHTTPDGNALFELYVPVPAPEADQEPEENK